MVMQEFLRTPENAHLTYTSFPHFFHRCGVWESHSSHALKPIDSILQLLHNQDNSTSLARTMPATRILLIAFLLFILKHELSFAGKYHHEMDFADGIVVHIDSEHANQALAGHFHYAVSGPYNPRPDNVPDATAVKVTWYSPHPHAPLHKKAEYTAKELRAHEYQVGKFDGNVMWTPEQSTDVSSTTIEGRFIYASTLHQNGHAGNRAYVVWKSTLIAHVTSKFTDGKAYSVKRNTDILEGVTSLAKGTYWLDGFE